MTALDALVPPRAYQASLLSVAINCDGTMFAAAGETTPSSALKGLSLGLHAEPHPLGQGAQRSMSAAWSSVQPRDQPTESPFSLPTATRTSGSPPATALHATTLTKPPAPSLAPSSGSTVGGIVAPNSAHVTTSHIDTPDVLSQLKPALFNNPNDNSRTEQVRSAIMSNSGVQHSAVAATAVMPPSRRKRGVRNDPVLAFDTSLSMPAHMSSPMPEMGGHVPEGNGVQVSWGSSSEGLCLSGVSNALFDMPLTSESESAVMPSPPAATAVFGQHGIGFVHGAKKLEMESMRAPIFVWQHSRG